MYDNSDPNTEENRGPYYVPWKKSSMDFYEKMNKQKPSYWAETRYKTQDGYIDGSTLGNVPTKEEETNDTGGSEEKKDN